MFEYDVLIIGSGPAGYYCARSCAKLNLKTAIVEKEELGGTGFRWGCLPVKKILDQLRKIEDLEELIPRDVVSIQHQDIINAISGKMVGVETKMDTVLKNCHVDIFFGDGSFQDEFTFLVENKKIKAKQIIIATGTSPTGIGDVRIDGEIIISHKEAIGLNPLPKDIIIVGGNVEGIEFASMFSNLGVKVTVIEKEDRILKDNDKDLVMPLEERLIQKGVEIVTGVGITSAKKDQSIASVLLEDGRVMKADKVLFTGFRKPNFPLGIEKIGVKVDADKILVNEKLQTSIPHIYAIGDINGLLGMAHVAISQGNLVMNTIQSNEAVPQNYQSLPRAIFTVPEIAGTGAQEWELQDQGIPYRVEKFKLMDTWRGFSKGLNEGFVKVLVGTNNQIIGVWMVGKDVSELVGVMGVLVDKKMTIDELIESLYVHPSLSEAIMEAMIKF